MPVVHHGKVVGAIAAANALVFLARAAGGESENGAKSETESVTDTGPALYIVSCLTSGDMYGARAPANHSEKDIACCLGSKPETWQIGREKSKRINLKANASGARRLF
jgi:hypothetical protein